MYCGAQLADSTTLPGRETDSPPSDTTTDPSVLVVCRAGISVSDASVDELAARFQLKSADLLVALATGAPLPLSRRPSTDEANQLIGELENLGVESYAMPEAELGFENPPLVIRAVGFETNGLFGTTKHRNERRFGTWDDLGLIVSGRLIAHRVEVDEKRGRGSVKNLDRRELTEDQSVVDIYLRSFDVPWRIFVNDFDFSCLGDLKGLTAFDNIKALREVLAAQSQAVWDDSYSRLRPILGNVWPLESTSSESRSRRPRASRNEVSKVTASDNESQFTRYSRLLWNIRLRELETQTVSGDVAGKIFG
jgi:hypothetical protein